MTRPVPSLRWFVTRVAFLALVIPPAADAQSPTTFSQTTIPVNGAFTVATKAPVTTTTPLVAGGSAGVSVLTNNGAGGFSTSLSFPGASAPSLPGVAIGDVNGDGVDDIVTLTTILFGQLGGTYIQQGVGAPFGAGSVDVGNVNGDPYADMVFSVWGSNSAILRLGKPGAPGSWSPGATVSVPVGANPFSARIVKLNGDAYGDVVVANGSGNSITTYLGGPGPAYLTGRADYSTGPGGYPTPDELGFADVDNDFDVDVLAVGRFPGQVYVFLNNGLGGLGPAIPSLVDPTFDVRAIAAGDFNNDGLPDIVVAIQGDFWVVRNLVAVLYGDGAGHFTNTQYYTVGRQPASVVTGDFNGDGWADFAVGNAADNTVTVMLNMPPIVDRDHDGVPDGHDNCPDAPNPDQSDADADGLGDFCDPTPDGEFDTDHDGILDRHDNCVDVANPGQEDTYGDNRGDACEPPPLPDTDHDGVSDLLDNCPDRPNPTQVDTDGDGTGDSCDPTPEGDPVAPLFTQPFPTPDEACLCTPVLMNLSSTGTQHWWVRADSTGTGVVGMRVFAVSVNNIDPETVQVRVYDAGGTEVAGSPVSTGYPGGTAPGTETFTDLGFSGTPGAIYRLDVTTPGTPSTQPHYRFEFKGAEAVGTTTATSPSFEEARRTRWYFNTAASEPLDVKMFVTGTLASETIADYTLTDPAGAVTTGTLTATLASDATIPAYAVAAAGTWSLLLEDKSTNANPANGHYGLTKASGADTGVYLGWESYGEAHVTIDIPAAGDPAEVTFTNTVTGETFVFSGVNDGDVLDVPVGSYDVSATGPAGRALDVSPSTIDLWCTLETELAMRVRNRRPTLSLPLSFPGVPEGLAAPLNAGANDPDGDPLTFVWEIVSGAGTVTPSGSGDTATYLNADGPDTATVRVTVTDAQGATASAETTIGVDNVSPGVVMPPNAVINEGDTFAGVGSFTDPGADTWTATVEYSPAQPLALNPDKTFGVGHTYADDGTYTVTVNVSDDDGDVGTGVTAVKVNNVAPRLALTSAEISEGGTATLIATITDPGVLDSHQLVIDWNDGAPTVLTLALGTTSVTVSHAYVDDNPSGTAFDIYSVIGTVTDDDGGVGGAVAAVKVNNVAPGLGTITGPTTPQLIGTPVALSASYTEPGSEDTLTCSIAWGDGATTLGTLSAGACNATHTYAAAGVYTVSMSLSDDDTGSDTETFQYVVIYSGSGFVTGGGWFNSGAGAYRPDPAQTGRANFGFNARNRADGPTGQVEFQFHRDGRMNFRSSSYDWLVVSGPWALYVGSGTINGSGDYAFLVSVIDGRKAGDRIHRLRMKIWDKGSGAVIYDNNPTAGDDYAMPTLPINNGSIVIH